ncbi:MAG: efflux RND transporter periplasmic adaptor subunit [Planctomycetaceae bacterium]
MEIRSPITGTIVEKNFAAGTLVDVEDTLFRVADLSHLDVRAFAYEEDLTTLQRLAPSDRKWDIRLRGDALSGPIHGSFDRIGSLIDPVQHTGLVMGWVDNSEGNLRAGQFVTATVTLPDPVPMVSVPASAVVDLDARSWLLVQDPSSDVRFLPMEVRVVRFQDGLACLPGASGTPEGPVFTEATKVVSQGALEILAEFRTSRAKNRAARESGQPVPESSETAAVHSTTTARQSSGGGL